MLSLKYLAPPKPVIATRNFSDIDEGIVNLYGFVSDQTASDTYILGQNTPYSYLIETTAGVGTGPDMGPDLDFDMEFNLPKLLKGTCYIQYSWVVTNSTGSNSNFPQAIIRKWDGTTETDILLLSGSVIDSASGARRSALLSGEIPATLFKAGETLRVTCGISKTTAGSNPQGTIGHDPQNRDGTVIVPSTTPSVTTKLQAFIPFRII